MMVVAMSSPDIRPKSENSPTARQLLGFNPLAKRHSMTPAVIKLGMPAIKYP